jgi:hypothetical protein
MLFVSDNLAPWHQRQPMEPHPNPKAEKEVADLIITFHDPQEIS